MCGCASRCAESRAARRLVLYRPDPDGEEVLGSATIAATRR